MTWWEIHRRERVQLYFPLCFIQLWSPELSVEIQFIYKIGENISPVLKDETLFPFLFTHPVYHRFEKGIPEVVCNNLYLASPFPLNLSHLLLLYFHHYFPECLSTRGVSLAFNLWGVSEQINILLLTTQPLWTLGCVCNLALARNVNCLVAALHSGPVGLLWVEEKGIFFYSVMDLLLYDCWMLV